MQIGFTTTNKKGKDFILGASSFHGNPYDGHTLQESIAQAEKMTETKIKAVFVNRGYKVHDLNPKPKPKHKRRKQSGMVL
jgi:IS5 family transposase